MTGGNGVSRTYSDGVARVTDLWNRARSGEPPDPATARRVVVALATALERDPAALIALTEATAGDNVVFTHMVNVAVLTLAQSRALGIRGPLLEVFGMAALLHDIGKVCIPPEILCKPGPLTAREFTVVKRHVLDGERILRRAPGMPALAAVVAFEHHLKHNFSGYPEGIARRQLNACTSIVAIADVFDALRGDCPYRAGLTASRIHVLMSAEHREEFHSPLLRHFVQVMTCLPVCRADIADSAMSTAPQGGAR